MRKRFRVTGLFAAVALFVTAAYLTFAHNLVREISGILTEQTSDRSIIVSTVDRGSGMEPARISHAVIDQGLTSEIGSQSIIFEISDPYDWYNIYINNDSYVTYNILLKDEADHVQGEFTLAANSSSVIRNTEAARGRRIVSVTSSDGSTLEGSIRVSVSRQQMN
ncbi:hypothetical protein [Paenibacillus tarimensis]|uniref:hypothetical protein n=1 Tax=Paenibacillus tarimensis TaxID=416012 RepID=UPI001F27E160|nr:hypothetical protein [Paenibacillus tarimensis]MCF2945742.1 hypothetical protein [Paenibacillus tarimensis]